MRTDDLTQHLAEIVRASRAAIVSVSLERKIESWNPGAVALFGWSAEEALGGDLMMIVPADRMDEAKASFARVSAGEVFETESVRLHKSGRRIDVSISLAPIRDEGRRVVGTCAVVTDLTARKTTERSLLASERDFRTFFESVAVGNVIADARTGRFLQVNRHFCELTGYSAEELLQMNADQLTAPEDLERDRAGWREARTTRDASFTIEKRYLRKNGSVIWVRVTSTLVRDGKNEPLHAIGVIRDVTDRRQAIEELERARQELEENVTRRTQQLTEANAIAREAAHRFETLIEHSPLPTVSFDRAGQVHIWNPAAETIFGWRKEEVAGQLFPILPTQDREQYLEELRAAARSRERAVFETQCEKRDGTVIDVTVWRAPLFDPNDELSGSVAILVDRTERKLLERALLESSERECRRIGQELHDHLCQHLLGAAFAAKALGNSLPKDSPAATGATQLAHLINSAVQQARDIARGLNPVELDSSGLMAALQELTQRVRNNVSCRLECEKPVLLPDAEAALHAYRIAQDSIMNAVSQAGATEIVVRLSEDPENVFLQITGNGRGNCASLAFPDGLGWQSIKYRAHALGGRLWIDNRSGAGTSVTCALPKRNEHTTRSS